MHAPGGVVAVACGLPVKLRATHSCRHRDNPAEQPLYPGKTPVQAETTRPSYLLRAR